MKLTDLNPSWVASGGDGITYASSGKPVPYVPYAGVQCDCPCGNTDKNHRLYIPFANPFGNEVANRMHVHGWEREGETFESLTLRPSILRSRSHGGCGWHGYITDGNVHGQIE